MIYDPLFTADLHLGHSNVIKYCDRPFADVHEMNKGLIENWNSVVGTDEHVYLVGDISFSRIQQTVEMLKLMHGKKFLVAGNHDKHNRKKAEFKECFEWIVDYHELSVQDATVAGGNQLVVLCHFPLLAWNRSRYGSWMLHGHLHGTLDNESRNIKRYDCGVDQNDYFPIRYSKLKEMFSGRKDIDVDTD